MEKPEENKDKIPVGNDGFGFDEGSTYKKSEVFPVESSELSTKPDFKQFAKETYLIIKLGAEKPERVIREKIEHVWNTHVVPLQESLNRYNDLLSERNELYHKSERLKIERDKADSDNKLLREDNKHLISKYVNLDEINITTYASHTKEELIKELNYYQNVVCAAKDNTNRMLLEEIERLKAELNFKQGCIDAKNLDV